MSLFHNSVEAERLATGWHCLGVFISSAIVIVALLSGWLLLMVPAAEQIPMMKDWLTALFLGDSVIGFAGAAFHIWATKQHLNHLRDLRQPKDYVDSCR